MSAVTLAADADVALVTVAVKVTEHFKCVTAAVAAGKDVYCEWPLGVNTEQAKILRDHAVLAGVRHIIGLQARQQPVLQQLRQLVHGGRIGRVLAVHVLSAGMGHGAPVLAPNKEWVADARNGLSALTVRGAHTLDAVQFAVGRFAELSAEVAVATPEVAIAGEDRCITKTAPDQVAIQGRLVGGASVSGYFVLGVHATRMPLMTVYGSEGTLEIVPSGPDGQIQMARLSLVETRGAGEQSVLLCPGDPPAADGVPLAAAAASVSRMYRAIADGHDADLPDFDEAVRLHELLDVIRLAADTGRRQCLA
jgi:predicted dehydrogenase